MPSKNKPWTDHAMSMAQFLEMQRIREATTNDVKAKHLDNILLHAIVTNPFKPTFK